MSKQFYENNDGVHLMSKNNPEYSICGDAFDVGSEPNNEDLLPTTKTTVTCSRCIAEIMNCRNVKVGKKVEAANDW